MRVVLDSNIYISAVTSGGRPLILIQKLAEDPESEIFYSDVIVAETLRVLRDKFKWPEEDLREAEALIAGSGKKVVPTQTVDAVRDDPTDNRIVECALEAGAEYLVTGDNDLLRLGQHEGMRIVRVTEFLARGIAR